MSRVIRTIRSRQDREQLCKWIMSASALTVVELRKAKSSNLQNDLMWTLLGKIQQAKPELYGMKMSSDKYKCLFLSATGEAMIMLPTLDGDGFIPYGHRSSELSKSQMSDVIECIYAFAAREGIDLGGNRNDQV